MIINQWYNFDLQWSRHRSKNCLEILFYPFYLFYIYKKFKQSHMYRIVTTKEHKIVFFSSTNLCKLMTWCPITSVYLSVYFLERKLFHTTVQPLKAGNNHCHITTIQFSDLSSSIVPMSFIAKGYSQNHAFPSCHMF